MSSKNIVGRCKICGQRKKLSYEHILPRIAGGGQLVQLYQATDVLEAERKGIDNPYGKIYQNGYGVYSLCKECNEYCGSHYDKDFAKFYRTLWRAVSEYVEKEYADKTSGERNRILRDRSFKVTLLNIKPFNIAKRVLASFCSIEYEMITDSISELRETLTDKEYSPKSCDYHLYMCLHLGSPAYFGTLATRKGNDIFAYAGMEANAVAFYFTKHGAKMRPECLIDITDWLQKYCYDQTVDLSFVIPFHNTLGILFPPEIFGGKR